MLCVEQMMDQQNSHDPKYQEYQQWKQQQAEAARRGQQQKQDDAEVAKLKVTLPFTYALRDCIWRVVKSVVSSHLCQEITNL